MLAGVCGSIPMQLGGVAGVQSSLHSGLLHGVRLTAAQSPCCSLKVMIMATLDAVSNHMQWREGS